MRTLRTVLVLGALTLAATPGVAHAGAPDLRLGFSGAGGGFAGTVHGAYGGVQLRLGVQWTRSFATYVMAQGLVGKFVPSSEGSSAVGYLLHSLMFEGTAGRVFQFGGGPSLDFLWGCNGPPANASCGTSPVYFGLDGRLGLHFHPLTISFDAHPIWFHRNSMAMLMMFGVGVDF